MKLKFNIAPARTWCKHRLVGEKTEFEDSSESVNLPVLEHLYMLTSQYFTHNWTHICWLVPQFDQSTCSRNCHLGPATRHVFDLDLQRLLRRGTDWKGDVPPELRGAEMNLKFHITDWFEYVWIIFFKKIRFGTQNWRTSHFKWFDGSCSLRAPWGLDVPSWGSFRSAPTSWSGHRKRNGLLVAGGLRFDFSQHYDALSGY